MEISGRTALLTGATGGLGRAIARALAERGAGLVLSGRSTDALETLAAELPGEHRIVAAELGDPGAVEPLLEQAGPVDILVANAGLPGTGPIDGFTVEETERVLRVNLEVPVKMARALVPTMRERDSGHMVFVSSLSGKVATARAALYNATKFGLRGFAFALREDLRGSGVGVSLVSPGMIRDAGMWSDAGLKTPPGLGTRSPEDVARAVVRAIEHDESEIVVASPQQRFLGQFGLMAPELAGRLGSRGGATKIAAELAEKQKGKR